MLHRFTVIAAAAWLLAAAPNARAHEGHKAPSATGFDLNAPRHVSEGMARLIGLETAEIDFGIVEDVLQLVGVVRARPDQQQTLVSRLSGTVVSVRVQVGDLVKKGDPIAELDSIDLLRDLMELEEQQTELSRLHGEMNQADSRIVDMQLLAKAAADQASIAEEELQRLQQSADAVPANIISARQSAALQARTEQRRREIDLSLARRLFIALEGQAEGVQRTIAALRAIITLAGYEWPNPDATGTLRQVITLRAGMDGVVTARHLNPGQGAEAGQAILEIASFDSVQVEGELPASLGSKLSASAGHTARVRSLIEGAPPIEGVVRYISPTVDPVKRTVHAIIEAPNPGGELRPGLYVDVAIVLRQAADAVVVPIEAVQRDGPLYFVFLKEMNHFVRRDVQLGARDDRTAEVLDGLVPGDVVATRGAYNLVMMRGSALEPDHAAEGDDEHGHAAPSGHRH